MSPDSKFIVKNSKCAGLSQEIGFFCTKFVQLDVASKRRNTGVHLQLDLTVAHYFWLVNHNECSSCFGISNSKIDAVPVTILLVGLQKKKKQLNLDS